MNRSIATTGYGYYVRYSLRSQLGPANTESTTIKGTFEKPLPLDEARKVLAGLIPKDAIVWNQRLYTRPSLTHFV